ncbi:cell division protein FtsH, partial [Brachyspira catarrhinii]
IIILRLLSLSLDIEDIERICEVKLYRIKDKLVYAGKDPKRGTDELEDDIYQNEDAKSVKEEVFNSPLKSVKKSEDSEEKSTKMMKKTTSMKRINPKKKKEDEE